MSKKLLSVVLALALAISCFAVVGFAVGGLGYEDEKSAPNYTQTWALGEPVPNGDGTTYSVDVKLTATAAEGLTYLVGPIQFKVDKKVKSGTLELTDVTLSKAVIDVWGTQGVTSIADFDAEEEEDIVIIFPKPAKETDAVSGLDLSSETVIATLEYTSTNAAATLAIDVADAKTANSTGGTLFAARMSDGNVVTGTPIVGQTVTPTTNTVTIGSVATPPELVVKEGTIGVIDTTRTVIDAVEGTECDGYVYGVEPFLYETVGDVFEVVGDGEMEIVPSPYGSENGTGAMVQVIDDNENVVAEYVLIIFGDVDGDGEVTSLDVSEVEWHAGWVHTDTEEGRMRYYYQDFAGDVDGCGEASALDVSEIESSAGWVYPSAESYLSQREIITRLPF